MSKIELPVGNVLQGAMDAKLDEVAVVGRYKNGRLYVAGSSSTPNTIKLFERAVPEIDRLTEEA